MILFLFTICLLSIFLNFSINFYLFFLMFLMICNSVSISLSINPIHSIFFLISTFLNAGILLIVFNMDFIGLLFIIIYVGAIAIFFLFIIMMLNLNTLLKAKINANELFLGFVFFIHFILLILFLSKGVVLKNEYLQFLDFKFSFSYYYLITYTIIGELLYGNYILLFFFGGFFLFLIMLGSIVLIHQQNYLIKSLKANSSYLKNPIETVMLTR